MPPYPSPLLANGKEYDLLHLSPFTFTVESTAAQKKLVVFVRFSLHCIAVKYGDIPHPAGFPIMLDNGGRERSFCHTRYELSKQLPCIIRGLVQKKVIQTASRRNWVYTLEIETPKGPYYVFFEIRRSSRDGLDLDLFVESAYPKLTGSAPKLLGKMKFAMLCGKIYQGKAVATRR